MTQREKNNYKFRVVWRTVLRSFAIKIPIVIPILLLGIGIFFSVALAAFNQQINFQGKLTDSSDLAVSDNTKCMQFLLYNHLTATGDALLWSEEWTATSDATLSTTSGLFSVLLGSNSSLSNVNFNQDPIYLEVQFDASCDATYEEVFSPRKRLGAVPAAFEAKKLVGSTWASPGAIGSTTPNTGAFTTFTASGLATFSYTPQGAGVGQGSLYINPATATADYTLLGLAVGGTEKFKVDAEGDLVKVGNITMPSTGWLGLG
ncbi:MAG: hypothetical protein FJZ07_00545, partial [Candidatus Nealsonbacteria bacterium]|nr:hypothetical protein [Candidatus Nealsonbacteria bacterium]